MPETRRQDDLLHIPIEREPDIESERRRGEVPPPPARIAGRSQHGKKIASNVAALTATIAHKRQQAGVDPSRFLVLEFASWDASAREIFETRLNATVVDERVETRAVTRLLAVPSRQEGADVAVPEYDNVDAVVRLIEAAERGKGDRPSPAEAVRLRRANKEDIKKATRGGRQVPDVLVSSPSDLLIVEAVEWTAETEQALHDLGVSPVAATREAMEVTRVLVQFPTIKEVDGFRSEALHYVWEHRGQTKLPHGLRRRFFDGLEWVRSPGREDRIGARLGEEGFPAAERFVLDVDLWHPGTVDGARAVLEEIRRLCKSYGGRVVDDLRTSSLVLARVEANRDVAEVLLGLDIVAQVNLPPVLPVAYGSLFEEIAPLPDHFVPDGTEPVVAVVDSGVLASHPLIRGWVVEERDFDSGENTAVDRHGHGTQVAGLVVYGDIARCIESGEWTPKVLVASAKVLRCDPIDETRPVFPENRRPERLVEDAIRYFHRERGCRIFNLSVGNAHDVYAGGRQFAWAEVLDQLARELDVVVVVSAGNFSSPPLLEEPATRDRFQLALRDLVLDTPKARVCNPATAAIAVTVGAISRSATSARHVLVAAPEGAPAPFSRVGPGYEPKSTQRGIKPDFVAFGGNYAVRGYPGLPPDWVRNDIHLGEPTTRLNKDGGRALTAVCGTSFAAPQVSFAAAFALRTAGDTLGTATPTANSARAILGACAEVPPCGLEWLRDPKRKETWERLRLVGYGQVDVDRVIRALQHDVCLLAEDLVAEDHWHLYTIRVPPAFQEGRGRRGINVSLAFDPPVRASRRDYLSRTMWVEVLKGLTIEEIRHYRSRYTGDGKAPLLPRSKLLNMQPAKTKVQWSTLQVRRYSWVRKVALPVADGQPEPVLHVLVGCQKRFPSGEDPHQRYALAVRLWHTDTSVEIHQQIRSRVRARVVARVRLEPRS